MEDQISIQLPPEHRLVPPKMRRARSACLSCRSRKVRCNATTCFPGPCTNCQLDQLQCIVGQRRRPGRKTRPRPSQDPGELAPADNNSPADATNLSVLGSKKLSTHLEEYFSDMGSTFPFDIIDPVGSNTSMWLSDVHDELSSQNPAFDDLADISPSHSAVDLAEDQNRSFDSQKDFDILKNCDFSSNTTINSSSNQGTALDFAHDEIRQSKSITDCRKQCMATRYHGLTWLTTWCSCSSPLHLSAAIDDAQALTIPSPACIEMLLGCYFRYDYWVAPVVSEWETYLLVNPRHANEDLSANSMSLALLNAILFAGSAHVSAKEAKAANFATVREMRGTFYKRAKALYEADCEQDDLNRLRICLLLSSQRKYPTAMFENEFWILRAQSILQQPKVIQICASSVFSQRVSTQWKRLRAIYSYRICYVRLGNRSSGIASLQTEVYQFSPKYLEEDTNFTWFVNSGVKRQLVKVLMASCELIESTKPLSDLLHYRNILSAPMNLGNKPVMSDIEQIEYSLDDWRTRHKALLQSQDFGDEEMMPHCPLFISQVMLRLLFEYLISTLHRTLCSVSSTKLSSWSVRMCDASQEAVEESASRITRIMEEVLEREAIRFLGTHSVICISVPLTVNFLALKVATRCTPQTVYDLSTCLRALGELALQYEVVDFFCALNDESLVLTQEVLLKEGLISDGNSFLRDDVGTSVDNNRILEARARSKAYSVISRFQDQALAKGSVKIATDLLKTADAGMLL